MLNKQTKEIVRKIDCLSKLGHRTHYVFTFSGQTNYDEITSKKDAIMDVVDGHASLSLK